jgi:hypothetical protein
MNTTDIMNSTTHDKKNQNLNNINIQKKIFKYLMDHIPKRKYDPIKIHNWDDVREIKENVYYVVPKFIGAYSWMLFLNIDNCYFAITIHKKSINNQFRIYPIDACGRKPIYDGTIIDGIFFKKPDTNQKYFIINEVYYLEGRNMTNISRMDRMSIISEYIKENIQRSPNYYIAVCNNYQLTEDGITDVYNVSKNDKQICGWLFYPSYYSGNNHVFYYPFQFNDFVITQEQNKIFLMVKTNRVDGYQLYELDTNQKIGIAYIPNIATSHKCKSWFTNEDNKSNKTNISNQSNKSNNKKINKSVNSVKSISEDDDENDGIDGNDGNDENDKSDNDDQKHDSERNNNLLKDDKSNENELNKTIGLDGIKVLCKYSYNHNKWIPLDKI